MKISSIPPLPYYLYWNNPPFFSFFLGNLLLNFYFEMDIMVTITVAVDSADSLPRHSYPVVRMGTSRDLKRKQFKIITVISI